MAPQLSLNLFTFSKKRASRSRSPAHQKAVRLLKGSLENMVGKSNKFDFTHRGSSGVKLGQSIAEAFRKDVDKAKKDAERHAAKMRKRGSTGTADSSGTDIGIHIIDFKAPSKDLGDEGVLALAPALAGAIEAGSSEAFLCLEDIKLSGNGLTVKSLAALAPVVKAAMFDLKSVNLANNNIRIETAEDAAAWEMFLTSFKSCVKLRLIDLSGNHNLGAKAFEIFTRCYQLEEPVSPVRLGGDTSVQSLDDTDGYERTRASPPERTIADACFLKRRRGLRSLSYLDIKETGLDDAGALWLSFVLPQHYFPDQLTDSRNAAPLTTSVSVYQQGEDNTGIEWAHNEDTLGKDGLDLLCKVENIRGKTRRELSNMSTAELVSDFEQYSNTIRRLRSRGSRSGSVPAEGDAAPALNVLRHRLQRQIIQNYGLHSVELWHSTIKTISLSRRLLVLARANVDVIHRYTMPLRHTLNNQAYLTDTTNLPSLERLRIAEKPLLRSKSPRTRRQYLEWQVKHDRSQDKITHILPWLMPFKVFDNIIRHVMTSQEVDAMSETQRYAAYKFGQTRTSLNSGMEWSKLNNSAQLVKLLESVHCLTYEAPKQQY